VVEVGGAVVTGRELCAGKSQDTERRSPVQVVEVCGGSEVGGVVVTGRNVAR